MERPLTFQSDGHELLGILHLPEEAGKVGLIMLAAGAQYRLGPHRQQVLVARALAEHGIPTLRYDASGMADSCGPYRDFEMGPDIDAAVATLLTNVPGLEHVVLWGICGSASAILIHERRGPAVSGVILVNPWVRSEQSQNRAYLKHYYLNRLIEADLWRKVYSGRFDFRSALSSFASTVKSAFRSRRETPVDASRAAGAAKEHDTRAAARTLEERMANGLELFEGRVLLIMSEQDLTARKFDEFTRSSKRWRRLMRSSAIERRDLRGSDHTFSQPQWREQVIDWMTDWVNTLAGDTNTTPDRGSEWMRDGTPQHRGRRRTAT
jgi:exosortase A-associated hydrolase 1